MKTTEQSVIFRKEQVQHYVQMLGDRNPIYKSVKNAKAWGLLTIPIPPAMPMTVYRYFKLPWTRQGSVILRKQQLQERKKLYIDEQYTGIISLSNVKKRRGYTFSTETLYLYDQEGCLCFTGISELVSGDIV